MYAGYGTDQNHMLEMINKKEETESRLNGTKKTTIGVSLLIGSFGSSVLGVVLTPISCLSVISFLAAAGLGIAGLVLMIIGSKAFSTSHKVMVLTALGLFILSFVLAIFIGMAAAFATIQGIMGSGLDSSTAGSEIIDMYEGMRPFAFLQIIPGTISLVANSLMFFGISKNWGRILLGVYIFVGIITLIGVSVMKDAVLEDFIDDIDEEKQYTTEEQQSLSEDFTTRSYPSSLIGILPTTILIIAAIGSLLLVKERKKQLEQELTSMINPGLY